MTYWIFFEIIFYFENSSQIYPVFKKIHWNNSLIVFLFEMSFEMFSIENWFSTTYKIKEIKKQNQSRKQTRNKWTDVDLSFFRVWEKLWSEQKSFMFHQAHRDKLFYLQNVQFIPRNTCKILFEVLFSPAKCFKKYLQKCRNHLQSAVPRNTTPSICQQKEMFICCIIFFFIFLPYFFSNMMNIQVSLE